MEESKKGKWKKINLKSVNWAYVWVILIGLLTLGLLVIMIWEGKSLKKSNEDMEKLKKELNQMNGDIEVALQEMGDSSYALYERLPSGNQEFEKISITYEGTSPDTGDIHVRMEVVPTNMTSDSDLSIYLRPKDRKKEAVEVEKRDIFLDHTQFICDAYIDPLGEEYGSIVFVLKQEGKEKLRVVTLDETESGVYKGMESLSVKSFARQMLYSSYTGTSDITEHWVDLKEVQVYSFWDYGIPRLCLYRNGELVNEKEMNPSTDNIGNEYSLKVNKKLTFDEDERLEWVIELKDEITDINYRYILYSSEWKENADYRFGANEYGISVEHQGDILGTIGRWDVME